MKSKLLLDPSNLKMAHKTVVLVSVPLVLGSILSLILFVWLRDMQEQADHEAHTRLVINQSDAITQTILDGISALMGVVITRSQALAHHYDELEARSPHEFQALAKLVSNNPGELASVEQMRSAVYQGSILLNAVIHAPEEGYTS